MPRAQALVGIDAAFFWLAGLIAALQLFILLARGRIEAATPAVDPSDKPGIAALVRDAVGSRWAVLGAAAIFLYVGAEVAIGTQMAFFLNSDAIWGTSQLPASIAPLARFLQLDAVPGVSFQEAGRAMSLYWGGAMVGRIVGSALLARVPAARLLALFTASAAAMCLYVVCEGRPTAGFVALAIGLVNSIMYPVIFSLTLERSTASVAATSGLLCTAIVGGAALPPLVGAVAGLTGYVTALIKPTACYVSLVLFAIAAARARPVADVDPFLSVY